MQYANNPSMSVTIFAKPDGTYMVADQLRIVATIDAIGTRLCPAYAKAPTPAYAGNGFTMALFIANLAFCPSMINTAKFGILSASIASATLGIALLAWLSAREMDQQFRS